jgi:putative nucleotidyltransferase with HDIG domain
MLFRLFGRERADSRKKESADTEKASKIENGSKSTLPSLGPDDPEERFKIHLKQGLDDIFSSPNVHRAPVGPLEEDAVSPEVISVVTSCINNVKDFGTSYKISRTLDDPDVSMSQIAETIMIDPMLSGKILKAANSAYFSGQKVDSVSHALNILGANHVKNIIYYQGLSKIVSNKGSLTDMIVDLLWEHSVMTSICASNFMGLVEGLDRDVLFTLGLLHDIGKFINTDLFPIRRTGKDYSMPYAGRFTLQDEAIVFGINHTLIGKMAFETWGLSDLTVRMVEMHHSPATAGRGDMGLDKTTQANVVALFLANQIAKLFVDEERKDVFTVEPLDPSYHDIIDPAKLESRVLRDSFISEVKKAKALMESYR